MTAGEQILQYLLDAGEAQFVEVKWGKGHRNVVLFKGKKYQYKGGANLNKNLLKSILPLYISMSEKSSIHNTNTIKNEAATKIIGAFNKRINLIIDKIDVSLKGKVKSVRVIPKAVGKNQHANIDALVENSYKVARREMPSPKKFQVYAYLKFPSQQGGDDFEARTVRFSQGDAKDMLVQIVNRTMDLLQSDHEVLLKDFQITFNFIEIPEGGAACVLRDEMSILNKKSVNRVTNNDNNCFWYALVMLIFVKHPQIKQIKMGRKIRETLAKELCYKCDMEWDKPVSFDEIPTVEKKLQFNIMILDMENIPILKYNLQHLQYSDV
jgi:hypothetical protein